MTSDGMRWRRAVGPAETTPQATHATGALAHDAWTGSPGVDAVATFRVLGASRRSVSAVTHDRTDPSATRSVRAHGLGGRS